MEITYTKDREFKLSGKNIAVAINPQNKLKADVILYSVPREEEKNDLLSFDGPGEYEVKGSMITGIDLEDSGLTAFVASIDDVKVAYLSDIKILLSDEQLDQMGNVDILLIDINVLSATDTSKVISQIEPRVVIPMNYNQQKLKDFEAEVGTVPYPIDKFKINKKDLSADTQQIVVLKG